VKILLDHCVPRPLMRELRAHDVKTTHDMGWDRLRNGILLAATSKEFDLVLTVDQNLAHQQNLDSLPVSVIVMVAHSNRLEALEPIVPVVERAIAALSGNQMVRVDATGKIEVVKR